LRKFEYAKVILHKTAVMLQIQDWVRVGYRFYTCGLVSLDRARAWADKADQLYDVYSVRNRRAREKKHGRGCAVLLMHPIAGSSSLWWILLVTPHGHLAYELEPLKDALEFQIELTGYELCHLTKPGAAAPVLTWRMTREAYENQRTCIIDTVRRGGTRELRRLIVSLHRSPGFYGIRQQVKACRTLLRAALHRSRGNQPEPRLQSRVLCLRRRKVISMPLSKWLSTQQRMQASNI